MKHHGVPPRGPADSDAPFRMVWLGIAAGLLALIWMVQVRITASGGILIRHNRTRADLRPDGRRFLQGHVLSAARIPVSGVRIAAVSGYGPSGIEVANTRSDDRGAYTLEVGPEATRITARLGERRSEIWLKGTPDTIDLILH